MEITPATVPGTGTIFHIRTREGQPFAVIDYHDGRRALTFYPDGDSEGEGHTVELSPDEADRLAELLHSPSLEDRLAAIERRLAELSDRR